MFVRVIDDLEFHSISAISAEHSVDPRCRFIPTQKEMHMGEENYEEKGFLSDEELSRLDLAVRRAKDMLAPATHDQMTRALWELRSLRGLARELLQHASASGLIEHVQVLRSRAMKVSPGQPCA